MFNFLSLVQYMTPCLVHFTMLQLQTTLKPILLIPVSAFLHAIWLNNVTTFS